MSKTKNSKEEIGVFLGEMISFRNSLKLIHWSITGKGSYETHISLDQAISSLVDITDRLVETTFSLEGQIEIIIPETSRPKEYIKYVEAYYQKIESNREALFPATFSQSIIDDAQEAIQQLLFRLKRLE